MTLSPHAYQKCISRSCNSQFSVDETLTKCPRCGHLLDVEYDWSRLKIPEKLRDFEQFWRQRHQPHRFSGVWRFHDLLPFARLESCLTIGEGQTILQEADALSSQVGLRPGGLFLQYEGLNPSGSFKDNGMAAALTHAALRGVRTVACASTGNTSASLAMFAAATGLFRTIVFVGSGKIAYGKLSQALDHGAITLQIEGDFDDAMEAVQQVCPKLGIYLVNSVNPFRLEGQKTIMLRILEGMRWEVPDWIVVPGGNLGNSSAFGKVFSELKSLRLVDRVPRLAIINAAGAGTLDHLYNERGLRWNAGGYDSQEAAGYFAQMQGSGRRASTVASAIEINLPVNLSKCLRALEVMDGVVRSVSDAEILDAKALIAKYGFGCEPASGACIAGVRQLRQEGIIGVRDVVACVLTGHLLKDPTATVGYHTDPHWRDKVSIGEPKFANQPIVVPNNIEAIMMAIQERH